MPLPKEIVEMLVKGELKTPSVADSSYLDKLPTLDSETFPDELRVWDIATSGTEEGKVLHKILKDAGLTDGQRAGVTHLLDSFVMSGENNLTIGDIRALSEEELIKLRGHLAWGAKPSVDSIKKIKRLLG